MTGTWQGCLWRFVGRTACSLFDIHGSFPVYSREFCIELAFIKAMLIGVVLPFDELLQQRVVPHSQFFIFGLKPCYALSCYGETAGHSRLWPIYFQTSFFGGIGALDSPVCIESLSSWCLSDDFRRGFNDPVPGYLFGWPTANDVYNRCDIDLIQVLSHGHLPAIVTYRQGAKHRESLAPKPPQP